MKTITKKKSLKKSSKNNKDPKWIQIQKVLDVCISDQQRNNNSLRKAVLTKLKTKRCLTLVDGKEQEATLFKHNGKIIVVI